MIDTREPPDGDFARYVENLSRLPPGHGVNPGPRAPGSQGRAPAASMESRPMESRPKDPQPLESRPMAHTQPPTSPSLATRLSTSPDLKALLALGTQAARMAGKHPALASAATLRQGLNALLLRALRAISGAAIATMLAGIALIVLSDIAELPFQVDPSTGLKVFAGGFAVLWLARAARARMDR